MAADAGPVHGPLASVAITESNDDADAPRSAASASHAADAANNGPAPAPAYISAELISGGNTKKSIGPSFLSACAELGVRIYPACVV